MTTAQSTRGLSHHELSTPANPVCSHLNADPQKARFGGTWLAQSEEHVIRDLRVVSSSSTLGEEITKTNKQTKKQTVKK